MFITSIYREIIRIKVLLWNVYKIKTTGPKLSKLGNISKKRHGILYSARKISSKNHYQCENGAVCCIRDQGFQALWTPPLFIPIRNSLYGLLHQKWHFANLCELIVKDTLGKKGKLPLHVVFTFHTSWCFRYKAVLFLQNRHLSQVNDAFIFEIPRFTRKVLLSVLWAVVESMILWINWITENGGQ